MLAAHVEALKDSPYARSLRESTLLKQIEAGQLPLVWGRGEVLFDHPVKVVIAPETRPSVNMEPRLRQILEQATAESLLISPYFVPREQGVAWFKQLRDHGVRVRILTNSLASTDEPAAYGGYAHYRRRLLALGIDLFEAKPTGRRGDSSGSGSLRMALHSKAFIVDGRVVFIGSFNLDPRSARLDTQNGIVLRSPEMGDQLIRHFQQQISPARAFQVMLEGTANGDPHMPPKDTRLIWIGVQNDKQVLYCHEPLTGFSRRFSAWFLAWILPETSL